MPVSPARAAAFDILLRVDRESSYASELLHSATSARLSTQDHALTTELVMGVLRWQSVLDDEIAQASSQPLTKLDPEILIALRIALYQFRSLDRIPPRAALHESVELVKRARKRSAAPFVNAVLRKLSKDPQRPSVVKDLSPHSLAHSLAHPIWLVERWALAHNLKIAEQICQYDQSIPKSTIRLRDPNAEEQLAKAGIVLTPGAFLASARRVESGDVTQTQAFSSGEVVIQDEASQLVAALVGAAPNESSRILDCCAAPGGKTLSIADHNPQAEITAIELHPHRARQMQDRLRNAGSDRIHVVTADITHLPIAARFDRILADVPCSGTGTLARNPEIKWRLKPDDLIHLQTRQLKILRSALQHLAPGGRLIYSTCSLEKEENEDVIEKTLVEDASIRLLNCSEELNRLKAAGELTCANPDTLLSGPYLRTIPGLNPCDGFFAVILEKAARI